MGVSDVPERKKKSRLRVQKKAVQGLEEGKTYAGLKELEQTRLAVVVQHQDSLDHSVSQVFSGNFVVSKACQGGLKAKKDRPMKMAWGHLKKSKRRKVAREAFSFEFVHLLNFPI